MGMMPYLALMRVHRPVGTLLLLWPTLAALWMAAEGPPPLGILAAFVAGTFLARSAGCVANDIVDRDIDGHVRRTRQRPLARGAVSLPAAAILLVVLGALCVAIVLLLNPLTWLLAAIGAAVAVAYPFFKRWTHLPQAVLGVAFSWGIPMAFAAATGTVAAPAWILFAASLVWIVAYDTQYAMVDRPDDVRAGVKSIAILFGRADLAMIAVLQAVAVGVLILVGMNAGLQIAWLAALAVVILCFGRQHWLTREREPARCFTAFRSNVWVGFALFIGAAMHYALTPGEALAWAAMRSATRRFPSQTAAPLAAR